MTTKNLKLEENAMRELTEIVTKRKDEKAEIRTNYGVAAQAIHLFHTKEFKKQKGGYMHYYQFNIGDYAKDTRYLTNIEDLAYRRLIDLYYDTEQVLTLDVSKLARLISMKDHISEITSVLEDFFTQTGEGYQHSRIESDIKKYKEKSAIAKANGRRGGRPPKSKGNQELTKSVISANQKETGSQTNHKPLTINHNKSKIKRNMSTELDMVNDIFSCWRVAMSKNESSTKLTAKRKKLIQDRLKEGYTLDQIKKAIGGCRADPFSMGDNDQRKKYNDIELICRTGAKLEYFMEIHDVSIQQPKHQQLADEFEQKYGYEAGRIEF